MKHRLLILLVCAASLNFAQDLESRARTAVAQKRFNDGLALYKTLLAGNPTSVDYMLWMGRLSAWTGEYTGAVEYYSQALASQPANIDALVGKANALLWKNSYREALVVLTQARELAPLLIGISGVVNALVSGSSSSRICAWTAPWTCG